MDNSLLKLYFVLLITFYKTLTHIPSISFLVSSFISQHPSSNFSVYDSTVVFRFVR